MTTHQRAALAQAALVNFFGEAGTVASILNRVQPSHTQTLSEVSDEQDLDSLSLFLLKLTLYLTYLNQHNQQHILLHNKIQTDKATKYHITIQLHILLLMTEERDDIGHMIITIKGNIQEKMIENKPLELISM